MKLVIKSGESVENALNYLRDFLEDKREQYPLLKGNMNIYITLEGFGHREFPDNGKEYILSGEQVLDVEQSRLQATRKLVLVEWQAYLEERRLIVQKGEKEIKMDLNYLETADAKGRDPERVKLRQKQTEKKKVKLESAKEQLEMLETFNRSIAEGEVRWMYKKDISKKSPYIYELSAAIIFKYKDGSDWVFQWIGANSWRSNSYGILKKME